MRLGKMNIRFGISAKNYLYIPSPKFHVKHSPNYFVQITNYFFVFLKIFQFHFHRNPALKIFLLDAFFIFELIKNPQIKPLVMTVSSRWFASSSLDGCHKVPNCKFTLPHQVFKIARLGTCARSICPQRSMQPHP